MWTKFGSYSATIDHDISQSLVFYFIVDTVYNIITYKKMRKEIIVRLKC